MLNPDLDKMIWMADDLRTRNRMMYDDKVFLKPPAGMRLSNADRLVLDLNNIIVEEAADV